MWQHKLTLALVAVLLLLVPEALTDANICIKCSSDNDANCIADVTKVTTKDEGCASKKCFAKVDVTTGIVARGCLIEAAEGVEATTCTTADCLTCNNADNCNNNNVCIKCDSSTDVNCSQTDSSSLKTKSICTAATTKCLTKVKDDKNLERRCVASDDEEKTCTGNLCQTCSGGSCNTGIFPADRKRCYQCAATDTKCSNVVTNSETIKSLPCVLYAADDMCYTYGTADTAMTRGCVSDSDKNVNKCSAPESDAKCATCSAANCNNLAYKYDATLKCVQCNSKDDTSCMWGQSADSATNCKNQIEYNKQASCYLQTKDDVVTRGCVQDRDATLGDCSSDNNCTDCKDTDGCNNKDAANFTCIRCRSDENTKCPNEADQVAGSACRNVVTKDTAGCFHGIWNNVVIRGCMVDADIRMQVVCNEKDNKQCTPCPDKDCNSSKTSGATTISITTGLLSIILLALWRLY